MDKPKFFTAVIPIIRPDMVERCLDTLYEYTEAGTFYVIVVDQTIEGLDATRLRDKFINLMIIRSPKTDVHTTGNLGFQQATNLGLSLTTTPYMVFLNDDVEFINAGWWAGIMETFEQVEKATPTRPPLLVNAASIKLPDWSVGLPRGEDHYILPYKEKYSEQDWRWLIDEPHYVNQYLTITPGSVIDGINLYCSVADTRRLLEVGGIDDLWYPGSAGDYDLCCIASMHGYRCVGTTKSWVFHHWSKSFQDEESKTLLVQDELKHLSLEEKWGYKTDKNGEFVLNEDGTKKSNFDMWGIHCSQCNEILRTTDGKMASCPNHEDERFEIPQNTMIPL